MPRCTSSDSAALHTLTRWVLELTAIAQRHLGVGRGVDVDVAVAHAGLDHRHGGLLDDRADEVGAAARDQHVDQPAGPHQRADRVATALVEQRDRGGRQAVRLQRAAQDVDQGAVAGAGGGAAPQHHGVAALEGEPGGVDRDVGPGLVDHADHAHGHPDLADLQAVGQGRAADHLPDGVGQPGDVAQRVGHGVHATGVEAQAVDQSPRPAPTGGRARCPARWPRGCRPWPPRGRRPWRAARRPWSSA